MPWVNRGMLVALLITLITTMTANAIVIGAAGGFYAIPSSNKPKKLEGKSLE
jgi:hypothetical protein